LGNDVASATAKKSLETFLAWLEKPIVTQEILATLNLSFYTLLCWQRQLQAQGGVVQKWKYGEGHSHG
jgi:hypothetical protein